MPSVAQAAAPFILKYYDKQVLYHSTTAEGQFPLVVYVSGPQGSGKTYSSRAIRKSLLSSRPNLRIVVVSIDDFYLTHKDQLLLSERFAGNALLQGRGLPGTHDLALIDEFLHKLRSPGTVGIPAYDKSRFGGEGDRVSPSEEFEPPIDILVVEGWFLGFQGLSEDTICSMRQEKNSKRGQLLREHSLENLLQINSYLSRYSQLLWGNASFPSLGIVIAADTENIYTWRQEQETELIAKSGQGMNSAQVKAFVSRYMPCYEIYYPPLKATGKLGNCATLVVDIDHERNVTGSKVQE
ncbi:LADA_0F09670g1_1 [Lachancea dasiensis]|uniref:LADA_0F09670g1_1 n=1 Tax=Lachancea dasiensis TaxID=1072105 RepID=A0A1G4JL99_9SACH|nr:LADA_0F09670g1_1 [Lachancea dasiensis]